MKSSRRGGHLSLVRESVTGLHRRGAVISTDLLARNDADRIRALIHQIGIGGVLTGVVSGATSGISHPLILYKGKLFVLRLLPAELSYDPVAFREVSLMLLRWQSHAPQVEIGELKESLLWVLRPFYGTLLEEYISSSEVSDTVVQLVDAVDGLHRAGLRHGHLTPSNVAVSGGRVLIVDPLIGWCTRLEDNGHAEFLSDAGSRFLPSRRDDLYGLGLCIEHLIRSGGDCSDQQREVLAELLSPSRASSLDLEVVRRAWTVAAPLEIDSKATKRGKLISSGTTEVRGVPPEANPPAGGHGSGESPSSGASAIGLAPAASRETRGWLGLCLILGLSILGAILWQRYPLLTTRSDLPLVAYWESQRVELMTQVAQVAVLEDDREAQDLIISGAMAGKRIDFVRSDLIRRAFHPAWAATLDSDNRRFILASALNALLPRGESEVRRPAALNAGVLFALMASRPIGRDSGLQDVSLAALTSLPSPYGDIMQRVFQVEQEDPTALIIAVCHLLSGDVGGDVLETIIPVALQGEAQEVRLGLLREMVRVPEVHRRADDIVSYFDARFGASSTVTAWFSMESPVSWDGVAPSDRLSLLLGDIPNAVSGEGYLADLLTFPVLRVRALAVLRLGILPGLTDQGRFLQELAVNRGGLTRNQIFTLLGSVRASGEARRTFARQWLQLKPSPLAIVFVLGSLTSKLTEDPLLIEFSHYVLAALRNGEKLPLKDPTIADLARSSEPLVRGIAYLHIVPTQQSHRGILVEAQKRETVPRLKAQVDELLGGP